jgi:hypothetical protein
VSRAQCGVCGRFVKDVRATVGGLGEPEYIERVTGLCSVHGEVDAEREPGWSWEDFYPEPNA